MNVEDAHHTENNEVLCDECYAKDELIVETVLDLIVG
jgi:hypothetical protein